MIHPFRINYRGKLYRFTGRVRKSLPYMGIARRALGSVITYNTDIDATLIEQDGPVRPGMSDKHSG